MRSDLLDAQASLDWGISNLPSFEERLNLWLQNNIKTVPQHTDGDATHDVIIAVEKEPFPIGFSVEAGMFINAMRSALDILAWTIFKRDVLLHPDEVYFPIANSEADWRSGNYKGSKFVAQLGATERGLLETLKPYGGDSGNSILYWLHRLDIARKHRRLLNVEHRPAKLTIMGNFKMDEFVPLNNDTGFIPGGNYETILGLWAKGAAKPKLGYTPGVFVTNTELMLHGPIMPLLGEFSRRTQGVINLFGY
jgi:hypothetical protein